MHELNKTKSTNLKSVKGIKLWVSLYSFKTGNSFSLPFFAPDDDTAQKAIVHELKKYDVDVQGKLYHVGKFNLADGKFKTLVRKVC